MVDARRSGGGPELVSVKDVAYIERMTGIFLRWNSVTLVFSDRSLKKVARMLNSRQVRE